VEGLIVRQILTMKNTDDLSVRLPLDAAEAA